MSKIAVFVSHLSRLYYIGFGGVFTDRWRVFHHLTNWACCSWLTQIMSSSALGSPPNAIGLTYHFPFKAFTLDEVYVRRNVKRKKILNVEWDGGNGCPAERSGAKAASHPASTS